LGACHYCMNCGRCKGGMPKPIMVTLCPSCGLENERGTIACLRCGTSLVLGEKTNLSIGGGMQHIHSADS